METKAIKKDTKKASEPIIVQQINIRSINRTNQDIEKWRTAIRSAESVQNPNRSLLYDLYFDLLLDAQLLNTTNTRRRRVTNSKIQFLKDGNIVEPVQQVVETPMFFNMLQDVIDSRFWGYTLLEFYMKNNQLRYYMVPRKHVKPEKNIITRNSHDQNGFDYTEPPLANYILSAGDPKDLGLYMSAAQYVLYKRGCFGDWAQFAEVFGMPFRWGKYDGYDENVRAKLNKALEEMGSAAFAVLPDGASVEIVQNNNNGNGEVYERLKNASDEQISLIMMGQTMTTKDGSSLSQAEVHADVADQVFKDDMRFILNVLNHDFKPILETFGINPDGEFAYIDDNDLTLKDRVYIDSQVAERVYIPEDHWYETYGIEKGENFEAEKKAWEEKQAQQLQQRLGFVPGIPPNSIGAQEPAQKKEPVMAMLYHPQPVATWNIPFIAASKNALTRKEYRKLQEEAKAIAEMIYAGTLPDDYFVSETMVELIAQHLRKAIAAGYGNATSFAAGSVDAETIAKLEQNIYRFSAAKNYNQLRDMNRLLIDASGERVSLNKFNQLVDELNIQYNRNWQATEYNTAQTSSQMASKWNQYQREAEAVPMLRWVTVGDERVRDSHRRLHGMTAPANDPIWLRYWPPIDWNDRCDVIQVADDAAKRNVPPDAEMPKPAKGFDVNPGATGEVFSNQHPYFKGVPEDVAPKIFRYE